MTDKVTDLLSALEDSVNKAKANRLNKRHPSEQKLPESPFSLPYKPAATKGWAQLDSKHCIWYEADVDGTRTMRYFFSEDEWIDIHPGDHSLQIRSTGGLRRMIIVPDVSNVVNIELQADR